MHTPSNREGAASVAMSAAAVPRSTGPGRAGTFRLTMFRIVAAATALLLLVAFGTWQSILTPWMDVADSGGHGWVRTPALHRLADSASALLMAAVGVAALFLAIRPTGRSALLAWTAAMLGAIGAAGTVSAAMQGLDVAGAFLFSVAWLAVLVAPLVLLLHPERTAVLRGGTRSGTLGPPAPLARAGLLVLGAAGLSLAAVPIRADSRDALCSRDGLTLAQLPDGASVGTGSPRRAAQLLAARPDLAIVDIRGNVDTRLGRVPGLPGNATADVVAGKTADLDAVVLAAAGLARIDRLDVVTEFLDPAVMLPAPGQGALALECRTADADAGGVLGRALAAVDDADTRLSVTAERALLARLEAGCAAPVGALAHRKGSMLYLEAVVCSLDGARSLRLKKATDGLTTVGATLLGIDLAEELLTGGAGDLADLAGTA